MFKYIVFIAVLSFLILLGEVTRRKGFENLTIKRESDKKYINEGEDFKISIVVENNKWLPISFLLIKEKIPRDFEFHGDEDFSLNAEFNYHTSRLKVMWYERIKRSYHIKGLKRGTYLLKELEVSLGDVFGFFTDDRMIEDYVELLVYPKLVDIKSLGLSTNSLYGDNIIKRWIYKDPLYIRGIREYSIEDRMKDIHWKSSLKMNKLMVKDYDYTSDTELVLILNVQCSKLYWRSIDSAAIERGISLTASLAKESIEEGIPVGMWTNSQLIYYGSSHKVDVNPSLNSFKSIMEMCARVDYTPRAALDEYFMEKAKHFTRNRAYVVITSFLSEESCSILWKLSKAGYSIKLIDISRDQDLPSVSGIEKLKFKEDGAA